MRSVPSCTRIEATVPLRLSLYASRMKPRAGLSGLALSSRTSDSFAGLCGDFFEDCRAAPFFGDEFIFRECLAHAFGVGAWLVDFVDGDDDGDAGSFGVVDCFDGLRHHAVVCSDDEDDEVSDFRAASAERCERFMARGVEEDDPAGRRVDRRCADMLSDAAGFACRYAGIAQRIEEGGLAVVDVAHHGDDWRAEFEFFGLVFFRGRERFFFEADILNGEAIFCGDEFCSFHIDGLVDRAHHAEFFHQEADDFG